MKIFIMLFQVSSSTAQHQSRELNVGRIRWRCIILIICSVLVRSVSFKVLNRMHECLSIRVGWQRRKGRKGGVCHIGNRDSDSFFLFPFFFFFAAAFWRNFRCEIQSTSSCLHCMVDGCGVARLIKFRKQKSHALWFIGADYFFNEWI